MIKKCVGCGSELQYTDENKIGYTPKKDAKLCQRCFKLKNYNQKEVVDLKYNNDDILNLLNDKADVVFFVTDYLNMSKKVVDIFNQINKKKYLVINKIDFIPKSINKEKYINWLKETYHISDAIILTSATKNYGINELNNQIKNSKNSYICGFTNSGKSAIINSLCVLNGKKNNILSSLMPNTTLDVIKVNLSEESWVYDTPGFISKISFYEELYPKSFLKPVTLQIKPFDVININDLIYIKCDENINSFTFYMSNDLNIKKIYDKKIEFDKNYEVNDNNELLIEGMGFINIKNKCNISISNYDGNIELRTSSF